MLIMKIKHKNITVNCINITGSMELMRQPKVARLQNWCIISLQQKHYRTFIHKRSCKAIQLS